MNNKKNNKGFSLIELIVVVAIMAVLVGVLAPTYLKYVENSRVQKDISAVGEVVQAIKVAAADEDVNTDLAAGGKNGAAKSIEYTIGKGSNACTFAANSTDKLTKELATSIGKAEVSSNSVTSVKITATVSNGSLKIKVEPTLVDANDTELKADFTSLGNVEVQ